MVESSRGEGGAFRRALEYVARFASRQLNLWLLLAVQLAFYHHFTISRIVLIRKPVAHGFALAASVVALVGLVNLGLARVRTRRVAGLLNLGFVGFYVMLILYRWVRGAPADFALLATNPGELFSDDGLRHVVSAGGSLAWGCWLALLALLAVLELRFGLLSAFPRYRHPERLAAALVAANALFVTLSDIPNEFLLFVKSIGHYALQPFDETMRHADVPERFPLFKPPGPGRAPVFAPERRPNVFVIFMESFSSAFIGRRDTEGREITPFFNSLIERGAYHSLFFANSVQTERGQSGTICSVIPSFRRKIMTSYYDDHLLCLPELMRGAGYATFWAQAQPSLNFDNTGRFMAKAGFEQVLSMDESVIAPDEREHALWRWGARDDVFFRKFFGRLDGLEAWRAGRPLFVGLATVSNHTPFNDMPEAERRLFARPASFLEQYLNSIHLADDFLRTFFEELGRREGLRDSLVVLLGDHGYPVGQHGNTWNEVTSYDEIFRVPLLVLGAGVEPFRNDTIAYSQIDLGPSLLEWLGVSAPNAFAGVPVAFRADDLPREQHWIPLVQPYDGGYLASIRYPYKYVLGLTSRETKLFDLAADPHEDRDLAPGWGQREPLPQLASELRRVFLNQRLLDEDRFVPH